MIRSLVAIIFFFMGNGLFAQTTPQYEIRSKAPNLVALTNCKIYVRPGKTIDSGTILIENNRIKAVGKTQKIPANARRIDLQGAAVYPGFIEPYGEYGLQHPANPKKEPGPHALIKRKAGQHWNMAINPERTIEGQFAADDKQAKTWRAQGLTLVNTGIHDGIFRGYSAVVSLADEQFGSPVIREAVSQLMAFRKGTSIQDNPSSLMGSIALIRQTFLDADWYRRAQTAYARNNLQKQPEYNAALESLAAVVNGNRPVIFDAGDELSVLRAAKLAKEFGLKMIIKESGDAYKRLSAIAALNRPLIVPVNFPAAPDVSTPEKEARINLSQMKHWDTAPENPARLASAGVSFAFTAKGLKKPDMYLKNIRKAVARGLSETQALTAMTVAPAKMLGIEHTSGTIEAGKLADLVIGTDHLLSDKKAAIYEVWISGRAYRVHGLPLAEARGTWQLQLKRADGSTDSLRLQIKGIPEKLKAVKGEFTSAPKVRLKDDLFSVQLKSADGTTRLAGRIHGDTISGRGTAADGSELHWSARRSERFKAEPDTTEQKKVSASFPVVFPNLGYGRAAPPAQAKVLAVKNAKIWTSGAAGIIENGTMLVKNGKITAVGKNIKIPDNAKVIDASGLQLTPGIIDAHSHLAISQGVNEGSEAVTAEVRIGDVLNSDDINIYRQLSGGVTSSHILHGSANPIGGQLATIKLRWGALPEEMKIKGARKTIKFALGENVKQSNWGDLYNKRYPQTRMGVESIIRDSFQAAREYEQDWKEYNALSSSMKKKTIPPRRDLELDALLEVIHGERWIHCHSYVQSEILMLMRLAEDYGFHVSTFTHILEGYKVAGEMKKHGAFASAFADWWAYKFEVYDAIPYNAALMYDKGIVVSINSDNGEMARRLNQEAAKTVKYGGVPQQEALKFVTINPAIQMGIDKQTGSLEVGKDADFVLWNGNPLSGYSCVLQTWIDGRRYFDTKEDETMRDEIKKQRAALVEKIMNDKSGSKNGKPENGESRLYQCDTEFDFMAGEEE